MPKVPCAVKKKCYNVRSLSAVYPSSYLQTHVFGLSELHRGHRPLCIKGVVMDCVAYQGKTRASAHRLLTSGGQ